MSTIYLAEIAAYDSSVPGVITLRYATGNGYTTKPADTPANTHYAGRLKQPASIIRDMFDGARTMGRSRVTVGDLVLLNADGELDALLEYGFDGRDVTIKRGEQGAALSTFVQVFKGTMEQAEPSADYFTIRLRDKQAALNVPLQATKYAGNNSLPAGVEGTSDLLGKPKPIVYGSPSNVTPRLVNTSKLIYQVADAALQSVDAVYDRGVNLTVSLGSWTSRTSGFTGSIYGVAYGNGIFVAVGTNHKISSSTDGVTWTARSSPLSGDVRWVIFADGRFFIGSDDSGSGLTVGHSTDGINWTACAALPVNPGNTQSGAYGNGVLVIAYDDGRLASSTDLGVNWTTRTNPLTASTGRQLLWANNRFVIASVANSSISTDGGATWATQASTGLTGTSVIPQLAFGAGVFVIHTAIGPTASSIDGLAWKEQQSLSDADSAVGLQFENGKFQAISQGTTDYAWSSMDGAIWNRRKATFSTSTNLMHDLAFGPDFAIAVGENGDLWATNGPLAYASEADLLDDTLAPAPGTYGVYLAGGKFRLGIAPDGEVTCDVTQGANAAARTAGQVFVNVLTRLGYTTGDWSASDITALDTANASQIGAYVSEEMQASELLDLIAASVGAWWGVDRAGVFRIARLDAPSAGTSVYSFTKNDIKRGTLRRIPTSADPGRGLPCFKTLVRYGRNYTVQTSDVAGSVSAVRRAELSIEWLEKSATDSAVQTKHPLAPQLIIETLLIDGTNAATEATRVQTLRGTRRDPFEFATELNADTGTLDMGNIITMTHPRHGLSAGKKFAVVGITPNIEAREVMFRIWG